MVTLPDWAFDLCNQPAAYVLLGGMMVSILVAEALKQLIFSFRPTKKSEELKALENQNSQIKELHHVCRELLLELKELMVEQKHLSKDIQALIRKSDKSNE